MQSFFNSRDSCNTDSVDRSTRSSHNGWTCLSILVFSIVVLLLVLVILSQIPFEGLSFYFYMRENPRDVKISSLCQIEGTHRIREVSIWKSPIGFLESFPTDMYHDYVVLETQDPMGVTHYWSQEKLISKILIQHSLNKSDVLYKKEGKNRIGKKAWKKEPELLRRHYFSSPRVARFSFCHYDEGDPYRTGYHFFYNNCQYYAQDRYERMIA